MLSEESADDQVFAVIGGGFIGAEIAAALAMNGIKSTSKHPNLDFAVTIHKNNGVPTMRLQAKCNIQQANQDA